jgi:FKBP-type peptidyl-prolyl cis-trans isomerase SlpA
MNDSVKPDSLVTLHYRIALQDGTELISTFGATPATLKMGSGELAPTLERCLDGVPVGKRVVFDLSPEQAFGPHNPNLVERRERASLPDDAEISEMSMVEFKAPDGASFAGLVRELGEAHAVIDFNHPLAGKAIRFEVEVIGVL